MIREVDHRYATAYHQPASKNKRTRETHYGERVHEHARRYRRSLSELIIGIYRHSPSVER